MERYGSGQIKVVEYDLNWPAMFDQEREKLELFSANSLSPLNTWGAQQYLGWPPSL